MKLQNKFNLAIIAVFLMLAALIAAATVLYLETNTIREAENRVMTYTGAACEIYDSKIAGIHSAVEVLAYGQTTRDLLKDPDNEQPSLAARGELEAIRQGQGMDILSLLAPDGTVLLRTRFPLQQG